MRRFQQDLPRKDAVAKWPGLQTKGSRVTDPDELTGSQPLPAASLIRSVTCEACHRLVSVVEADSCHICDGGPYHPECLYAYHHCPESPPSRTGGEHAPPPPSEPGDRETGASWRWVDEEEEDSEKEEEIVESPAKMPRIYSSDNIEALMRRGGQPTKEVEDKTLKEEGVQLVEKEVIVKSKAAAPGTPCPGTPFRKTEPVVRPYATGNRAKVQEVLEDPEAFNQAMEEFQSNKFAQSNQDTHKARVSWWEHRAVSLDVKPLPWTRTVIDMAGALLKAGQYRSAAQYFASFKRERLSLGQMISLCPSRTLSGRVRGASE